MAQTLKILFDWMMPTSCFLNSTKSQISEICLILSTSCHAPIKYDKVFHPLTKTWWERLSIT